jgi:hypothetical protein
VWQLFDTNDNDGCWNTLEWTQAGWVPQGHKHAVYGALARTLRPGSEFWSLRAEPDTNLAAVHGLAGRTPDRQPFLVLTNNDGIHNKSVVVQLPAVFAGALLAPEVTDRVRLNRPLAAVAVEADGVLRFEVPAFSLVVFHVVA